MAIALRAIASTIGKIIIGTWLTICAAGLLLFLAIMAGIAHAIIDSMYHAWSQDWGLQYWVHYLLTIGSIVAVLIGIFVSLLVVNVISELVRMRFENKEDRKS